MNPHKIENKNCYFRGLIKITETWNVKRYDFCILRPFPIQFLSSMLCYKGYHKFSATETTLTHIYQTSATFALQIFNSSTVRKFSISSQYRFSNSNARSACSIIERTWLFKFSHYKGFSHSLLFRLSEDECKICRENILHECKYARICDKCCTRCNS